MDLERKSAEILQSLPCSFHSLKAEQLEILKNILLYRDSVGILPTGHGKSAIYLIFPHLYNELNKQHGTKVVVVTPLIALMESQVIEAAKFNLRAAKLPQVSYNILKQI